MDEPEQYKVFELSGRNWRVGKFSAMRGLFIAKELMSELLPNLGISLPLPVPVSPNAKAMGEEEFTALARKILSACEQQLPAGWTPIFDALGNFAVIGLEHDMVTTVGLIGHVLQHNFQGFMNAGGWGGVAQSLGIGSPSTAPTSTNTSTPQ
jgi:hypothetical protein